MQSSSKPAQPYLSRWHTWLHSVRRTALWHEPKPNELQTPVCSAALTPVARGLQEVILQGLLPSHRELHWAWRGAAAKGPKALVTGPGTWLTVERWSPGYAELPLPSHTPTSLLGSAVSFHHVLTASLSTESFQPSTINNGCFWQRSICPICTNVFPLAEAKLER